MKENQYKSVIYAEYQAEQQRIKRNRRDLNFLMAGILFGIIVTTVYFLLK
jgi:hypothetical protein